MKRGPDNCQWIGRIFYIYKYICKRVYIHITSQIFLKVTFYFKEHKTGNYGFYSIRVTHDGRCCRTSIIPTSKEFVRHPCILSQNLNVYVFGIYTKTKAKTLYDPQF